MMVGEEKGVGGQAGGDDRASSRDHVGTAAGTGTLSGKPLDVTSNAQSPPSLLFLEAGSQQTQLLTCWCCHW
jgi:hypothetical protein